MRQTDLPTRTEYRRAALLARLDSLDREIAEAELVLDGLVVQRRHVARQFEEALADARLRDAAREGA
ncbi:MAG: hypothetical protein Tsb0020_54440 [Haliangiales bacterium]